MLRQFMQFSAIFVMWAFLATLWYPFEGWMGDVVTVHLCLDAKGRF